MMLIMMADMTMMKRAAEMLTEMKGATVTMQLATVRLTMIGLDEVDHEFSPGRPEVTCVIPSRAPCASS